MGDLVRTSATTVKRSPRRPKVFIPQEPMVKNPHGQMVTALDMAKVVPYGDPVVCLPWGPIAFSTVPTIETLRDQLSDFTDNDFILCAGDPTIIAMSAMVASERNKGRVKFLKRDKRRDVYFICEVRL